MTVSEPLAIYVHFPYCKSRCPYCDFFRAIKPKDFDEKELVKRYLKEIDFFADMVGERLVKSIFFGGGTPSILSADALRQVLDHISRRFMVRADAEISLEANPNTFDKDKFIDFRDAGINRLSLGVQALNDKGLKFLGRTHSLDEAWRAMELGIKTFDKFSIDLIYARPDQDWDDWKKEIDEALGLGLKHISLYQLSIEPGTVFYQKNIKALDEDKSLKLYNQTINYLRERGFERYEVSNFSYDKYNRSVHNMVYWQGGEYIGIGEGAHGRIKYKGKILATVDGQIDSELSVLERSEELLLMGLRIEDGIDFERFYQSSGVRFFNFINKRRLQQFVDDGYMKLDDSHVCLTDKGFLVLDRIVADLII